jgi:5-methylcytosine-specific restriction endonuclease McrBC regulatory subunit McrC
MKINLIDNNIEHPDAGVFQRRDVAALFPIANKTIADLCRENESILVFPNSLEASEDGIGESSIMNILNTDNPEKVRISTGNVMGFIGVGDLKIKIKSRFDVGRGDFFLHYMLQKVLSFNLYNLSHNKELEDVFDFILFMFPFFLKSALRQGVFRDYQNFQHNDANIKGIIDIGRHITRNIPFVGNIAYKTREYNHDNNVTELIRHTIEYMKTKKFGQTVLNIDRETIENVKTIFEHTPSYNKNGRRSIMSKNLRMKIHPYYTEYRPLQKLCLQILRMEEVKYGESDDEICGILFDGAWLWEEYVNTILSEIGFSHPKNKSHQGGIYLFDDHSGVRYPDFYNNDFVLDAKYKRLGSYDKVSKVDRDDVHQIIAYINALHTNRGGFVVPLEQKQKKVPTSQLKDSTSTLSIFGIEISKSASSYSDFCEKMKDMEDVFVNSLRIERTLNNHRR